MNTIVLFPHEHRLVVARGRARLIRPLSPQPTLADGRWTWRPVDPAYPDAEYPSWHWVDGKDPTETGAASIMDRSPFGRPGAVKGGVEPDSDIEFPSLVFRDAGVSRLSKATTNSSWWDQEFPRFPVSSDPWVWTAVVEVPSEGG